MSFEAVMVGCLGLAHQVLCNYFGSVECIDSNGAEVFAMLMRCHKLHMLGGHNAMIERDSFSAIQWGLSQSRRPWRW